MDFVTSVPKRMAAPDPAAHFLAGFDALARAVRRARGAPVQSGEKAVTLSQYGLVRALVDRRQARVRELADDAGVSAPTATRILDALERRGIVERTRSPEDRRAVAVRLTDAGRTLVADQDEWMRDRQRRFYARLDPEQRELAPDLLFRLADLLDDLAAGPPPDGPWAS